MKNLTKAKFGCVVPGAASYTSKYAPGISKETVGSEALFLGMVTLPLEGGTKAHIHERHESAFYMLSGDEVELYNGDEVKHRDVAHRGDYLFIPAGVPHVPVNRSQTPAVFIGVRNAPTAQESACMRPELDSRIP